MSSFRVAICSPRAFKIHKLPGQWSPVSQAGLRDKNISERIKNSSRSGLYFGLWRNVEIVPLWLETRVCISCDQMYLVPCGARSKPLARTNETKKVKPLLSSS